jgi:hypothetical protein
MALMPMTLGLTGWLPHSTAHRSSPQIHVGPGDKVIYPITDFDSLKANVLSHYLRTQPLAPTALAILGELEQIRQLYGTDYLGKQRPDGMYLSENYKFNLQDAEPKLLERFLIQQRTFIGHAVLMGHVPRFPFTYLEKLIQHPQKAMRHFLDTMNWQHPWTMGNIGMATAYSLIAQWRTFADGKAKAALDVWLQWHREKADPEIGFWDLAKTGNRHSVMAGGAHQLGIFFMLNQEVPFPEQMVDTTLALQNRIGLFGWTEDTSHNSSDFDGLFILSNLYHRYDYRRADIRAGFERALQTTLEQGFAPEGGGYNQIGVSRKPDLWSTMVRMLTIAYATPILGLKAFVSSDWTFKPWHPFTSFDGGINYPHWESEDWMQLTEWPRA